MSAPAVVVTNHALVRWLRDVVGIDVEWHKRVISDLTHDARQAGAVRLELAEINLAFHFADRTVIDVTEARKRPVDLRKDTDPQTRKAGRIKGFDRDALNRERRRNGQTHHRGKRL